jgi:hypothetical protein
MFDNLPYPGWYWDASETGERVKPHQQRVVVERNDLADKAQKLGSFIDGAGNTSVFGELHPDEQVRLKAQRGFMLEYLAVLDARIAAF